MKLISKFFVLIMVVVSPAVSWGDAVYHSLASGNFTQDWSNAGLITANDNWSGVPSIIGYLGDYDTAASPTGVDPQTLLLPYAAVQVDVIANQTTPGSNANGGVAEFAITDPTVAMQGSGTADAPFLLLHLDSTGRDTVTLSFNLRDIDGAIDNAVQQFALQYRVGTSGNFTNVPSAYVADASTGPSLATLVTPITVSLGAWSNVPQLQLRFMTTNAPGSDEWLGVDDIRVTSLVAIPEPTAYLFGALATMLAAGATFGRRMFARS